MKLLTLLVLSTILGGCGKYENSGVLHETGVVEQVTYSPSQRGSGTGLGITTSGSAVVTSSSVYIPEDYVVVVVCQHGKFVTHQKDIWKKVRKDDKLDISYRERYKVRNDGTRELRDLELLDVRVLPETVKP